MNYPLPPHDDCIVRKSELLYALVHRRCRHIKEERKNAYAAAGAINENMTLPYVSANQPRSGPPSQAWCYVDDAALTNVIAILCTFKGFKNVVAVTNDGYTGEEMVECIDLIRSRSSAGITCVASRVGSSYKVWTSGNVDPIRVETQQFIKTASMLAAEDKSVVWCSVPDPIVYASIIGTAPNTMWIDTTASGTVPMRGVRCSTAFVPLFCTPYDNNVYRLNSGAAVMAASRDVSIPKAVINCVKADVLSARHSNGYCYSCMFMVQCHRSICCVDAPTTTSVTVDNETVRNMAA